MRIVWGLVPFCMRFSAFFSTEERLFLCLSHWGFVQNSSRLTCPPIKTSLYTSDLLLSKHADQVIRPCFHRQVTRGAATVTCTASSARFSLCGTSTSTTTATWRAATLRSWPGRRWCGWTANCALRKRPPCSLSPSPCWLQWWRLWWWRRGTGRGTAGRNGTQRLRGKPRGWSPVKVGVGGGGWIKALTEFDWRAV